MVVSWMEVITLFGSGMAMCLVYGILESLYNKRR